MVADLKLVIQLQDLDKRIAELEKEIAALPKHIAAIERTLESHLRKLEADRAALSANQRDRKQLEMDVQTQEQKISKLKNQMLEAKTNEQYAAFKREIEYCESEIRKIEDRILDRMSDSDALEGNVKAAESALAKEKQHVEAEKEIARERTAADKATLEQLQAERSQAVSSLTPAVYSSYEKIRKKRNGVAVAEAIDGTCTACHMTLRLQFYQELRAGDRIMSCESCGRILYYTPPPLEIDEIGPASPESTPAVESEA